MAEQGHPKGNEMTEEELRERIEAMFAGSQGTVLRDGRLVVDCPKGSLSSLLIYLKANGFEHLSAISCVDWVKENQFELVYHLGSFSVGVHIMVKTRINRETPKYVTIIPLFPNAQTYEREIHEMFGVDFAGNPRQTPFLLDHWKEMPPFRKDFDMREYVKRTFGDDSAKQGDRG